MMSIKSIKGNFAISLSWRDDRLIGLEGCKVKIDDIWFPTIKFINSGRLFAELPEAVSIGNNGQVNYLQRYNGELASYHKLHDFPFDKQKLSLRLWPIFHLENEISFDINNSFIGIYDELNIADWNIEGVSSEVTKEYSNITKHFFPVYEFNIHAHRVTSYYIWKVIVPLCLIVIMSWAVFWISPAKFGPQISLSATSMLTLIAFFFATTAILPKLSYLTILDKFIFSSTILVFTAFIVSLTTTYLFSEGKKEVGLLIEKVCRYLFPICFLLTIYLILIIK